jgi:hypothetical protein
MGGIIHPLFHMTQLTVYFTTEDLKHTHTHTQICMNIQGEVKCDKRSLAGPVIENLQCPTTTEKYIYGRIIKCSLAFIILFYILLILFILQVTVNGMLEFSKSVASTVPRNKFQSY